PPRALPRRHRLGSDGQQMDNNMYRAATGGPILTKMLDAKGGSALPPATGRVLPIRGSCVRSPAARRCQQKDRRRVEYMKHRKLAVPLAGLAALAYVGTAGAAVNDVQSNHYMCYKIAVAKFPSQTIPKPVATGVHLTDQFDTDLPYDALKNTNICNPATVSGSTWTAASGQDTIHLVGYQIKNTTPTKEPTDYKDDVHVFADQFGMLTANATKPDSLLVQGLKADYGVPKKCKVAADCASQPTNTVCDPVGKICVPPTGIQPPAGTAPLPSTSSVNNFKCYKIKDLKQPQFTALSQITI